MRKLKKMTFEEAKQLFEAKGYEYLGCRDYYDCRMHYWCKPAQGEGWFYVGVVDGWWGDHKPHIHLLNDDQLEKLKTMLM